MSDSDADDDASRAETAFTAHRCSNGHLSYPGHSCCPECGAAPVETVDLSDHEGTVVTWTVVNASPAGVREPNRLAIVEFDVSGQSIRAIGGTTDQVSIGDSVRPVYVPELRDPSVAIRATGSQRWDGVRFEPV